MANFNNSGGESSRKNMNFSNEQFSKEKTVLVGCPVDGFGAVEAEMIIDEIEKKCGVGSVVACVPKNGVGYEVVLRERKMMESVIGELSLNGKKCAVNELEASFKYVSILNLSMYVSDREIIDRFSKIGVEIVSPIKKHRMKSKNNVFDGTRIFKVKLPPNMASIPYSMKFSVNEKETAYYRVIHNQQVKVCSGCFSSEHIYKDCPEFKCFECGQQGHISRKCLKNKCAFCFRKKDYCNCKAREELQIVNQFPQFSSENLQEMSCRELIKEADEEAMKTTDVKVGYMDKNCKEKEVCTSVQENVDSREGTDVGDSMEDGIVSVNGDASHYTEDVDEVGFGESAKGGASLCTDDEGDGDWNGDGIYIDEEECFEMDDGVGDDSAECVRDDKVKKGTDKELNNICLNNCNIEPVLLTKSNVELSGENRIDKMSDGFSVESAVSPLEQNDSSQGEVRSSCDSLDEITMDTFPVVSEDQEESGDTFTVVGKKRNYLGIKRRSMLNIKPNIKAARLSNLQKHLNS